MKIDVVSEEAAVLEGLNVLIEHLPPSKVARLLAHWQVGQGDYVEFRQNLFADETVDSLCEKLRQRESSFLAEYPSRKK